MPSPTTIVLDVSRLTVHVPAEAGRSQVLGDLSFRLGEGEVVDVVGPSGSGKSTFLRALAGLMPDMEGKLSLRGAPFEQVGQVRWRTKVALVPQKPALIPGSVEQNLRVPWRFKVHDEERPPSAEDMRRSLDMLGMGEVSLERDSSRLSVGQQARLAFARVWLTSPEVLLLDEADASLDDVSVQAMTDAVRRFAAYGGPRSEPGSRGGVVRVRHRESDGLAARCLRMSAGRLEQVSP